MGTELTRRGSDTRLPLWSARALLESPDLVLAIHRDEAAAGAEILTTDTFRTHRRTLEKAGLGERAAELTALAVGLARQAAAESGREVLVAGSLSPLEDCYSPGLVPENRALKEEHSRQAAILAESGADLILVETQNTIRELVAAVSAAKGTGLPVIASMVTDRAGRLLSGESIEKAARALEPLQPEAVGINCVPAEGLAGDLERLARALPGWALCAYGNLGPPSDAEGLRFTREIEPERYTRLAAGWVALGARIVGGCCGTTAAHTAAMAGLRRARSAPAPGQSAD
jgi:S-methylmethionine-dependent homocysteine/selenocysteine methylase